MTVIRLARMTGYRIGRALAELGMRTHEFGVLDHLDRAGPISQQELGAALRIDPSNLVGLLDALQHDGLVVRARDTADRRRHLVGLTDGGHRRLESAKRATAEAESELLAPLARQSAAASSPASSAWPATPAPGLRAPGAGADLNLPSINSPGLDRRRLLGLFRPYRRQIVTVLALITFSAGLGMVSPFLLRGVLDTAIPDQNTTLLSLLVVGMIAIAVATGALGVAQTLISNTVGQRVMHDLRAQVYRHMQRLSLSFFTRTRTGEIQSRIANDIGGVQGVVTSTATSIVSNVTTVIAATVAMFLLDWRLAIAAFALMPLFIWMTRRVGAERRRITAIRQDRLADISSLVEESLSVSGILLGKTMGRSPELAERFERESEQLAEP